MVLVMRHGVSLTVKSEEVQKTREFLNIFAVYNYTNMGVPPLL